MQRGKRSLSTEASQHVKPLWCRIFDEELERRGIQAQASSFVTTATEITGEGCAGDALRVLIDVKN